MSSTCTFIIPQKPLAIHEEQSHIECISKLFDRDDLLTDNEQWPAKYEIILYKTFITPDDTDTGTMEISLAHFKSKDPFPSSTALLKIYRNIYERKKPSKLS